MAEHETALGASDEWYTPDEIFCALGIGFDLDVASPGLGKCNVPARRCFTKADNALTQPWSGSVWMNPPYGGRHGQVPWIKRFIDHGSGIAVLRSYTSADWFHDYMPKMDFLLWPRGKTKFIPSDELREELEAAKGGVWRNAPGHGIVLAALTNGSDGVAGAMYRARDSLPGMLWDMRRSRG